MTLLELLVALTIMAISVAMIYRAVGGSARGVAKLEQNSGRSPAGRFVDGCISHGRPAGVQTSWARTAPYAWQVASAPFPVSDLPESAVPLHALRITISAEGAQLAV
ncbi:type II secretion system protein [Delftia sp.]|uniref:PulJ/GspJ family protein n=1 Tax=Delftia sp. TaxID=1886637 RepID=UPI00259CB340|nr:type II secretion system protein [Delftia sp.]